MVRRIDSPASALERLMECLLIAFEYSAEKRTFLMVTDFPDRSTNSDRELIAIVFKEVDDFRRESGNLPELARFRYSYSASETRGVHVIQALRTHNHRKGRQHVTVWFGQNLGGVTLQYGPIEAFARGCRVVEEGNEFIYYDSSSGVEIDFNNPFSDVSEFAKGPHPR